MEVFVPKEIQKASRAFPFALRPPESILGSLNDPNGSLSVIEVFLGHKREDSLYSPNMLAPIGGKMYPGETISQAAYRRVMQETALACSPMIENEESKMLVKGSFKFDIGRSEDPHREVYFSLVPVISPHIVTGIFPIQEDSKVDRLIGMTIDEFQRSLVTGLYDGPNGKFKLQGHITKLQNPNDVIIDAENLPKRDRMLEAVTKRLQYQEIKAKAKLYRQLKYFTQAFGKTKGIFPDLPGLASESLMVIEANDLKKTMISLKDRLGVLFNPIFKKAYSTVVGELYMDYFRRKELPFDHVNVFVEDDMLRLKDQGENIKKRLLDGNFGVDLLHFLPLFVQQEDSIKGKTTRLITETSRFIRDLFRVITNDFSTIEERRAGESKNDYENRRYMNIKDYFLSPNYSSENQRYSLDKMDSILTKVLSEVFGYTEEQIREAWSSASHFMQDLSNEAKLAEPEWRAFYQTTQRRNEIVNSSLAQSLLMSLGIDVNYHHPKEMSLLKFEALLEMLIFLKELLILPTYNEIIKSRPHPVDLAISKFFGSVQEETMIKLGQGKNERIMRITYRKGEKSRMVIVDEKPYKSLMSVIRKSFEERVEDIVDVFSCSIVLPNDAYGNYSFSERMRMMNEQTDDFLNFLQETYPGWKVYRLEDKQTFENYYDAIAGKDFSAGGKRTGSKGDLLIRRKVKIQMTDPDGKNYFYEIAIYPVESFSDQDHEKEKALGLMAWKEKIEDDPDYSLKRILFPLRGALGLHSIYELFNPPSVYPELIDKVRSKSVRIFTSS